MSQERVNLVQQISSGRYEAGNGPISSCRRDDLETARLQVEEKNATIECMKDQLRSERKAACDKLTAQRRTHATKTKELENRYRTIVKRHQKFIEQLIAEKQDLTQKYDSLARRTKETERKVQRDVKVINERHAVELQRARENAAASEKIRRERWLEMKTSKIKVVDSPTSDTVGDVFLSDSISINSRRVVGRSRRK